VYQNQGSIAEAIELAVYLEGYRPSHNKVRANELSIGLTAPYVGGHKRRSFTEDAGTADVWCVTTEIGSWTTCNDSGIFLTGNSTWNPFAQRIGSWGLVGWTPPGTISDAGYPRRHGGAAAGNPQLRRQQRRLGRHRWHAWIGARS
jgi:hypothetical protein